MPRVAHRAGLSCLQVHFCGVRGSLPAAGLDYVRYGGHTSCLALIADGSSVELPRIVPVRSTGVFAGDGWMGVRMRDASVVKGVGVLPIFAGLIGLLLLLGAFAATWVREGR